MIHQILKVFIIKKCIKRKTLHTLKTDSFEFPDNKNIGKLFSKIWTFFPGSSQIEFWFISNIGNIIPHPQSFPASQAISVKFPSGHRISLFNATLIMFFIGFPTFFHPHSTTRHIYWMHQTICQSNPIKYIISYIQIIISYWSNRLPVKKLSF